MRPNMGDTPAAETAKKTQSRIVEAEDVTPIASFVDETSGKVKRRRSERHHRSKTDEPRSDFFILEGPNGASHAMLPHIRRGRAPPREQTRRGAGEVAQVSMARRADPDDVRECDAGMGAPGNDARVVAGRVAMR